MGWPALKPLVILGATGSIGRQTLEVAERIGAPIAAIAARSASLELLDIALSLPDAQVCVVERGEHRAVFEEALGRRLHFGKGAVTEVAATPGAVVVNGIVGAAGLAPSLAALRAGNRLALANKESLVAGGPLMRSALEESGGELIPVDSEHSAIWQLLVGESPSSISRLILTASGGPFRGRSTAELEDVTTAEALDHPTWSMGPRITIDSATLMNKAFEVIEAHYLFDVAYDAIDVVVHPQSIVHSFVEFVDGTVTAEIGPPDMRKPIQYAITGPERRAVDHEPWSFTGLELTFEAPDRTSFPCLDLGYAAGRIGGTATAVLNAADEVAVGAFLDRRIGFPAIAAVVADVLGSHDAFEPVSIDDVHGVDADARRAAASAVVRYQR